MPDPLAQQLMNSLRAHIGALAEQQQVLEAQGADHFEASCRLNRGIHELETAARLLEARAQR